MGNTTLITKAAATHAQSSNCPMLEYFLLLRYMNLKIFLLVTIVAALLVGCTAKTSGAKKENWQPLFNGKDINDWIVKVYHHETGDNYGNTFRVEDGLIKIRYDQYDSFNNRYAHLYYKQPYSQYKLRFEYRLTGEWRKDAPSYTQLNSGIMFHSQDPRTILKEQDWPISVEFQLLAGLPDGKPRPTGNMCSPGTDVVFQGRVDPRHCINSSSKTYPPDQWVKCQLIVMGDSLITHIVEGDTVLQYSKPTIGGGVVNGADPKIKVDGTPLKTGFIALQSEGQPVDFRNIEILNLEMKK
jgi:hypothetical protein